MDKELKRLRMNKVKAFLKMIHFQIYDQQGTLHLLKVKMGKYQME